MSAAGTNARNVTQHAADDRSPAWSPDGQRIAFSTNRSGNYDIWSVEPDGTDGAPVTSSSSEETHPAWDFAGTRITFDSDAESVAGDLYRRTIASGTNQRLTSAAGGSGHASWRSARPPRPVNTVLPAVTGTAQVGMVLSVTPGTWTGPPASYTYAWLRCDGFGDRLDRRNGADVYGRRPGLRPHDPGQ
jgi:dipeptidyl aminopeptidase/acylaminoacyl peptidase